MGISFDEYGIKGKINKDITPENTAKLGCSVTKVLGNKIALSTDSIASSEMVKSALVAGILSGGGSPLDFGQQPISITRSGIKFYNLNGGFHISDGGKRIYILGGNGISPEMGELYKIMEICSMGELPRVSGDNIREMVSLSSYKLYYVRDLINSCVHDKLDFNILLCIQNPSVKAVMVSLLKEMDCKYTIYKCHGKKPDEKFSQVIKKEGYHLGAVIGEDLTLYDSRGRIISPEIFECICAMVVLRREGTYIASPEAPSAIEKIAAASKGKVIRTKSARNIIMSKVSQMNKDGLSVQFVLEFDPMGSIVKILDYIKSEKTSLEKLVDKVPAFFILKEDFDIGEERKRNILERFEKSDILNYKNSRAVVSEHGKYIRLTCEGANAEMAQELMVKYSKLLNDI
ncbi:MAG: hypothetical protein IJC89_03620 [Clostridia bacterium]|nr:hypothetical protein [Clostridia bacterium]